MIPNQSLKTPGAGIDIVPFNGWTNNLRLCNGTAELIITLDVGPRILSYTKLGGFNPFKIFEDQTGTTGEPVWKSRGGHRLWLAPEDRAITYCPDNSPVAWQQTGELKVMLTSPPEQASGVQKQIEITLDPTGTGVTLLHRVTRLAAAPAQFALWALTVLTAGGVAIVPQPPLGEHPRDLLPNRKLVLWPYTDMSDRRWHFGRRYLLLRQDAACGPTKIGLAHQPGWCGYLVNGVLFVKHYPWEPSAVYPDEGCNFETFTNEKMLELESLSPLVQVNSQQSVEHVERWELHDAPGSLDPNSEESLDALLKPVLEKI
ncbi:MAG: hypothetical protein JWQ04_3449 [Pedosphaera sp.]|nr:hypothetical protein [Pedosphaera sp.]